MARQDPLLTDWIKHACSVEMGLVGVLEHQSTDVQSDPRLQKGIDQHLAATRRHAELLQDCLRRMGENVSNIRPINPLSAMYGGMNGSSGPGVILRTELVDYVTENYEVASYRALSALARHVGDEETARACETILEDELAMVRALDQIVPDFKPAGRAAGAAIEGNDYIRSTQATFDAMNNHDVDRFVRDLAGDSQIMMPGAPGPLDKQGYREAMRMFVASFPDVHFGGLHIAAHDETVLTSWICTGTNDGPLSAPDGSRIPATHRRMSMPGGGIAEFRNGKVARLSVYFDRAGLMEQLGISQPDMGPRAGEGSEQRNVEAVRASYDALNTHDLGRWLALASEDFSSDAPGGAMAMDRQQTRDYLQNFFTAFPDVNFRQLRTIAQGDRVVVDWESTGTNNGPFHTPDGRAVPPTSRKARLFGSTTFELSQGKIKRSWTYFDMGTLSAQIGQAPAGAV